MRKIKGDAQTIGDMCDGINTVEVPISEKHVVDVKAVATNLETKMKAIGQLADGDSFTSAEFALEMIESPAKVTFRAPN